MRWEASFAYWRFRYSSTWFCATLS
jgi:hypothetical protein